MYNLGIARTGLLQVPPSRNLYYELLETAQREIEVDGVSLHGLRYDAEILEPYRNRRSGQRGNYPDKYPFRFDPRNLAEIYFFDQAEQAWCPVPWRGSTDPCRPFNRSTLNWAKALIAEREQHPRNEATLEETLNALLDRIEVGAIQGRRARIKAARRAIEARQHQNERTPLPSDPSESDDFELEESFSEAITSASILTSRGRSGPDLDNEDFDF